MVNRLKLHNLVQGQEQPVQQYVAALKQIARTCQFSIKCSNQDCNTRVDYSQEMVLDQLVRGLNDSEIQRKVLSCKEEDFNLDSVEKVVISEESSKASQIESKTTPESGHVASMSTYQKNKKKAAKSCKNCGSSSHNNTWELPESRKKECKAYNKFCRNCGKPNHTEEVCRVDDTEHDPETGDNKEDAAEHNSLSLSSLSFSNDKPLRSKRGIAYTCY